MSLSRLHDEIFLKDTRYACGYWEEHASNFGAMLTDLLTEETLLRIMKVAKETSLEFNEKTGALSKEDNEKLVRVAYNRLEALVQPQQQFSVDQSEEEKKETSKQRFSGKKFLFSGMAAYFEVLLLSKDEEGKPLREVFIQHKARMEKFLEPLVPEGYVLDQACSTFAPQLIIYFSYILWKYDQAMEGKLVQDYFKNFQQARENLVRPQKVEEMWTNIQRTAPNDEEEIEIPEYADQRPPESGQKHEAWIFQESAGRQREAVEQYWTRQGSEIRSAYNQLSLEDKSALFSDVRSTISQMGKGTYQSVLVYCPELNPDKLAGADHEKGTYSVHSFEEFVDFVLQQRVLPKLSKQTEDEAIQMLKHPSYGDPFVNDLALKLGGSAKLLPLVALSRQHLLLVFCHLSFASLLKVPSETVLERVPGCSELEESNNVDGMDFKFPFSSRKDREATPIGKPPIPGLQKRNIPSQSGEQVRPPKIEEVTMAPQTATPQEQAPQQEKSSSCSEPSCRKEKKEGEKYQVCSFCKKGPKSFPYCSRDCQVKHWKGGHKEECFKNKM